MFLLVTHINKFNAVKKLMDGQFAGSRIGMYASEHNLPDDPMYNSWLD